MAIDALAGAALTRGFPTIQDRMNMAASAYAEYAAADGTSVIDFALDVLLFAQSQFDSIRCFCRGSPNKPAASGKHMPTGITLPAQSDRIEISSFKT